MLFSSEIRAVGAVLATIALVLASCDPSTGAAQAQATPRADPVCGDGRVDDGEACDLGFANRPDGPCRACRLPTCGDAVRDPGESCDDGDDDETNACRSDCRPPLRERWVRRFDVGADDERVSALLVDDDGEVFVVGQRDQGGGAPTRAWVARLSVGGDVAWSVDLPSDGQPASASALAWRPDGSLVVVGTLAPIEDEPGAAWIATLDPVHGTVHTEAVIAAPSGVARAVAAQGERIALALTTDLGAASVLVVDVDGEVAVDHRPSVTAPSDARALIVAADGDLVAAGAAQGQRGGWIERLSVEGTSRWHVDDLDGPVDALLARDDGGVLAGGSTRIATPDPARPLTWTTAALVTELAPDGSRRWSTASAPADGRRVVTALAAGPLGVIAVGFDPIEQATCAPLQCETRPWLAVLDPIDGGVQLAFTLPGIERGRALGVGVQASGAIVVGGEIQRVFSRPDAWVSQWEASAP